MANHNTQPEPLDEEALATRALELLAGGCNCAQAVACALAPQVGLDENDCFRLMEGFGGGMGGQRETCGAISGGIAAFGPVTSNGLGNPTNKLETYRYAASLVEQFRELNGSTACRDLKGAVTGIPLRSCPGCVEDAVRITVRLLNNHAC